MRVCTFENQIWLCPSFCEGPKKRKQDELTSCHQSYKSRYNWRKVIRDKDIFELGKDTLNKGKQISSISTYRAFALSLEVVGF